SFRILGGYGSVVDALLAGGASDKLTLQLRSIVQLVRWKRGAVQITSEMPDETPRAVVRAKAAIVTLPVGVLKERAVRFEPDLPEKFAAMEKIEVGPVVKVVLKLGSAFWEEGEVPAAKRRLPSLAF